MSATSTRPSRPRISTIARRRSSLSTLILKRQYSSRKLGIMIALSFYIACFRLSSVRESKVSRWRRALFCASGAERERRLGGGGQPLRNKKGQLAHNKNSWIPTHDVRSLQGPRCYKPYCGTLLIRSRRGESIY